MNKELISIIITTYNRSKFLEETLMSIQNQTYQSIEIIVVDDGSNEMIANEVVQVCNKFSKCQYFWKQNTGQPDSRNYGIQKAKGEYIAFCDDDDFWTLDKLEKQLKILVNNKEYDIVTGNIEYIDVESKFSGKIKSHSGHNHGFIFEDLLVKNRTASVTPLLRKSVFEKSGFFNPDFTIAEDWDFWRKVSYNHKFYAMDEVLAYVRVHESNMTYKNIPLFNRVMLYRKLTKSLLKWGENRFKKEDLKKITDCERGMYHKLISNNRQGKINQSFFLLQILFKKPVEGLHILKTVLLLK